MAKIENEMALTNLESIMKVSDAILLPRGQIGTVMPIEKISGVQKTVIKLCNYAAKPVIIAS
jgi:pyruvate kinase